MGLWEVYNIWSFLFKGMSNFVSYLIPNQSLKKNSSSSSSSSRSSIKLLAEVDKGPQMIHKNNGLKLNVKKRLGEEKTLNSNLLIRLKNWPCVISSPSGGVGKGRCPWCNGNRHRKWTRLHEFKSCTRLIAFHIALIPLGKVMNPIILPPTMGK